MREIKFRAWSRRHEKYMDPNHFFVGANGAVFYETIANKKTLKLRNWILEQYTGLKDKNGKEIYEGDILKCTSKYTDIKTEIQYVESCLPFIHLSKAFYDAEIYEYEVVGNIHENPELLEVSE